MCVDWVRVVEGNSIEGGIVGLNMEEIKRNSRRTLFQPHQNKNSSQFPKALSDNADRY